MLLKTIFTTLVFASACQCTIPSVFQKCNRKEPDFDSCFLAAANNGMRHLTRPYKELRLPTADPLEIPVVSLKGGEGTVNLGQNYTNCKVHGLSKATYKIFSLNFEKKTFKVVGSVPELNLECLYQIDGRILVLDIKGQGNSSLIFKNFQIYYHADFEDIVKGTKTFASVTHSDLRVETDKLIFKFDNLFNGNKELSDNMNLVMNENWKELLEDLRSDYTEVMRKILTQLLQNVWGKLSQEELYD